MTTRQSSIADRSRAHRALRQAQRQRSAKARRLRAKGMPWKLIAAELGLPDAHAASRVARRNS